MFKIDDVISTLYWLERVARIAKDRGKPMPECMEVHTWTDVNTLLHSKANMVNLISELSIMVKMMESRKSELKDMLDDKV